MMVQAQRGQNRGRQRPPGFSRDGLAGPKLGDDRFLDAGLVDQLALQALCGHPGQFFVPAARFTRYRDETHLVES